MFLPLWKKYSVIFLFFLGGGIFLYKKIFYSSYIIMPLKTLGILGCHHVSKEEIVKVINLKQGDNLLKISLSDLEEKIRKLSWIRHVWIWRRLPSTLCIVVQEKKPWALWQKTEAIKTIVEKTKSSSSTSWFLIDENGNSIKEVKQEEYPHFIMLFGQNAGKEFPRLLRILWRYGRYLSIRKAHHHPSGRWDLMVHIPQSYKNRLLLGLDSLYRQDMSTHGIFLLLKMPWNKEENFLYLLETQWSFFTKFSLVDGRFPDGVMVIKD